MSHPITKNLDGTVSWTPQEGDKYRVTGRTVGGVRFSFSCDTWIHASGINLYRGSRWLLRNGKRYLIQRVHN